MWDIIDPTPTISEMYDLMDKVFFDSTLGPCKVHWSHKMTKTAGYCYQYKYTNETIEYKICLSAPILKDESRKSVIEQLLVSVLTFICSIFFFNI